MKKFIIITIIFLTPLPEFILSLSKERGAWGEVFAQEVNVTNDSVNAPHPLPPLQLERGLRGEAKDSIAQSAAKYIDSIASKKITDNIIATSTTIQELYKKITEDSIAQSIAIQKLYNKITENAITHSNAIQELYNKIAEDSIAGLSHHLPPLLPIAIGMEGGLRGEVEQPTLTFDAGQVFSTFKFIDSRGNRPKEFTHNRTAGFSLGYRYPLPNGLFIRINTGLRTAGASMIYEGSNVNWNIQYADANIGLGYIYPKSYSPFKGWEGGIKPYISVSSYFGYMLKGNQLIGAFNYDIKEIKSMKTTDVGLFFSPGLKIAVSKCIAFYGEYKYILGLKNLETATEKKSTNRGWAINLGIAVTVENLKAIKLK